MREEPEAVQFGDGLRSGPVDQALPSPSELLMHRHHCDTRMIHPLETSS